jgi:hypothetical protein
MQGENQSKSTSPSSLEEADFDCKYSKHVSLNYLSLFILEGNVFWDRYSAASNWINE